MNYKKRVKNQKSKFLSYKNLFLFLIILGGVLFFSNGAMAATYYVSQNGGGDGSTVETPESIADFNANVFGDLSDDTVYFLGNITTTLDVPSSGSSGHRINLRGDYPGNECTIVGGTDLTCGVGVSNENYISIIGFTITGTNTYSIYISNAVGIIIDSNVITSPGMLGIYTNCPVTIQNNIITSSGTHSLIYTALGVGDVANEVNILDNTLTVENSKYAFDIDGYGIMNIIGNTVTCSVTNSHVLYAGLSGKTGSINFKDNTVTLNSKATDYSHPIWIQSGPWIIDIDGNTINSTDAGATKSIIYIVNQPSPIVQNNTITSVASIAHIDIISTGSATGVPQILNNTLTITSGNTNYVIKVGCESTSAGDYDLDGAIIKGNSINCADGAGMQHAIFVGFNKNADIELNKIKECGYGIVLKGTTGTDYTAGGIKSNLIYDCNRSIALKGVDDVPVYNNTIALWNRFGIDIYENVGGDPSTGTILKNNIFYGDTRETIVVDNDSSTILTGDYSNNCLFTSGSYVNYQGVGKTYTQWISDGYNGNSVNANPLFTNVAGGGFTLQPLSPAIDAGTDVGLTTDYAGNSIYGAPDIGAYEYQPPYTMGTNKVDTSANVRVYGDGKFRNTQTPSGTTADLAINPSSDNTSQYLDVNISTWDTSGTYKKEWTESSPSADPYKITGNVTHTIGDLKPNTYYQFKLDGVASPTTITSSACNSNGSCLSNANGRITFTYTGGYSTHTFALEEDTTSPSAFTLSSPANNYSTSNNQPTLTWNASSDNESGLSHYQLYIDNTLNKDNITGTSATPSSALTCGPHTWFVKAVDKAGNTTNSETFNLIVACETEEDTTTEDTITEDTNDDDEELTITDTTTAKFHTDTTSVTLSLTTNENSTCKYSTENTTYDNMTSFSTTGETSHSTKINNLTPGSYTYYAICRDNVGNDTSHTLSFEIATKEDETDINDAKLKENNKSKKLNNDKKIYYNQKETRLKGEDLTIANGKVKIYKEGRKIVTVDVDGNGKWNKKITFSHNKTYTLKIKFYDKYGTLRNTKKYDVKIDTENPIFTDPFSTSKSIGKDKKITFTATDERSGIDYYKIKLLNENGHIVRSWRKQNKDWYKVPEAIKNGRYTLMVRAYDKAGNYAEEQTIIKVGENQNTIKNKKTENQSNKSAQTNSNQPTIKNPKTCSYIIQSGDTLWGIAQKEFGDGSQYKRITDLNPDLNTDALKIGQELKLCDSKQTHQNSQNNSVSQNTETQIRNHSQAKTQNQPQPKKSNFVWWNPFTWF